jgi:hypothetical protein
LTGWFINEANKSLLAGGALLPVFLFLDLARARDDAMPYGLLLVGDPVV